MSSSAASAISPSGLVRWAPFGVPVVPEVRITKRGLSGGGWWSESSPAAISCSSVVGPAGGAPSCQATIRCTPSLDPGQQVLELLVVDQRLRPLALHHLDQLRAGEHRVQVERPGAELGRRQGRLEEAAVVAAHDPDPVAGADPHRGEGVGERVGALVQALPGERAAFVEDRDLVRVLDRRDGDAGRRRGAPAQEGARRPAAPCRDASARASPPRAAPSPRRAESDDRGRPCSSVPPSIAEAIGRAAKRSRPYLFASRPSRPAMQAMPSPRPIQPIPSLLVALTRDPGRGRLGEDPLHLGLVGAELRLLADQRRVDVDDRGRRSSRPRSAAGRSSRRRASAPRRAGRACRCRRRRRRRASRRSPRG